MNRHESQRADSLVTNSIQQGPEAPTRLGRTLARYSLCSQKHGLVERDQMMTMTCCFEGLLCKSFTWITMVNLSTSRCYCYCDTIIIVTGGNYYYS